MTATSDLSNVRVTPFAPPRPNVQPRGVVQQYQVTPASNQGPTAGLQSGGLSYENTGRAAYTQHGYMGQPPPYFPDPPPPYSPAAHTDPPPPYSPPDATQMPSQGLPPMCEAASAPETGCILSFQRGLKTAGCAMIMSLAGVGAMLVTIALSPFVGFYLLLFNTHCCFIASLSLFNSHAETLAIVILIASAVVIASLPGIVASPVIGLSVAYQTGKWLYGDNFHPPSLLIAANNCTKSTLKGDNSY